MDMITKIIKDEFGPDLSSIAPIPGWGIGFMFAIMNKMGLTNYNENIELLIRPLCYYSILYDEIHIKTDNQIFINFINDEFNMTMNIINTSDITNSITYEKIFYISDSCDINSKLEINNEEISKYL